MKLPECETARAGLLDLLEGPADARIATHVEECPACSKELEALRRALATLAAWGDEPVPDPGRAYWEGFARSVRHRLESRDGGASAPAARRLPGPPARRMAAAAAVLACAATLAVRWSPAPPSSGSPAITEAALAVALRAATRAGGPGVEALGVEADEAEGPSASSAAGIVPEIGPRRVLEALRDTDSPAGMLGLWDDAEFEAVVRDLDAARAARLAADIHRAQG
jgi:hypothetical protein